MSKGEPHTPEDEKRLAEIFHAIDRNKDGRIDIDDLSALLKSKNVPNASDQAQVIYECHVERLLVYVEFVLYLLIHLAVPFLCHVTSYFTDHFKGIWMSILRCL